jgi:hypothetical protein
MASDFYQKRLQQILNMDLAPSETIAECIASLALGLDQLREEIQSVKILIIQNERARRGRL